jgi:hypothetical protein
MKKFAKKLFIFAVVPFLIIFLFDLWLRNINSIYKEKLKGLHKGSKNIEVLILGNSHASYGVDPNQFSMDAYNLANVSQSIYFDRRLTISNINNLPKLKYVFISLDFHSLNFESQGDRDVWSYYANGIPYREKTYLKEEISPALFGYTPIVSLSLLKKDITRKIKYRKIKTIDFDVENGVKLTDSLTKGFISFTGNSKYFKESDFKSRAQSFNADFNAKTRHQVLNDLEQFVKELKEKGIVPIFFATPTFISYNLYLNKRLIKQNYTDIHKLTSKYNLEYWDFSNSVGFEKVDFFNCDHLNKNGARKFSKMLNEKLDCYISKGRKKI